MTLLLDTHLVLWAIASPGKLPIVARRLMEDPTNELAFSAACLWEVAIKYAQGRPGFQFDPRVLRRSLLDSGYIELPILGEHTLVVLTLPAIHKDPFDRILVAQAIAEGFTLLTVDPLIAEYPGPIQKV